MAARIPTIDKNRVFWPPLSVTKTQALNAQGKLDRRDITFSQDRTCEFTRRVYL